MADEQDVIRVWLETNFAEALGKGETAVEEFRSSVKRMGPEVEQVFSGIDKKVVPSVESLDKVVKPVGRSFEDLSRSAFMAERAIGALATGQGLARTGPMLEGLLGFIGGPAGMGFAIAGVAMAAEKYIPMLIHHFDLMGSKTEESLKKVQDSLTKAAEHYKHVVENLAKQPAPVLPGHADPEATRKHHLAQLFNIETLPGAGGVEHGLFSAVKGAGIATPSELERREMDGLETKIKRDQAIADKASDPALTGRDHQEAVRNKQKVEENLKNMVAKLQATQEGIVERTVNGLIADAVEPGKKGKEARARIKNLIQRFPDAFRDAHKIMRELDNFDKAPDHPAKHASNESLEREYQDLEQQWDQTGRLSGRQAIERRMREIEIEMHPEIFGKSDPRTLGKGSPVDRIMHPELYGPTHGGLPRERHNREAPLVRQPPHPMGPPVGPPLIPNPQLGFAMNRLHESKQHAAERRQEERNEAMRIPDVRRAMERAQEPKQQRAARQYDQLQATIADLVGKQAQALELERQHISSHEKTQHVVQGLQHMLTPLLKRVKQLDANAKSMLQGQQRTEQNAGGN